jgi:hypothetical protein
MAVQKKSSPACTTPEPSAQDSTPLSDEFITLPTELQLNVIFQLDFPTFQKLRATSTYFRNLLSAAETARIRAAYVDSLVAEEREEEAAIAAAEARCKLAGEKSNETHGSSVADSLMCYTCLKRHPTSCFSLAQKMRKRSRGHRDAAKRFCVHCGVHENKWVPGMTLDFGRGVGTIIYCRRCKDLQLATPSTRRLGPTQEPSWMAMFWDEPGVCWHCCGHHFPSAKDDVESAGSEGSDGGGEDADSKNGVCAGNEFSFVRALRRVKRLLNQLQQRQNISPFSPN